jgi:hypothetical protein
MVFGLEHIGRFFDALHKFLQSTWAVFVVVIMFLAFILLNGAFIFLYYKIITTLPNLIAKVRYLIRKVDEWLD